VDAEERGDIPVAAEGVLASRHAAARSAMSFAIRVFASAIAIAAAGCSAFAMDEASPREMLMQEWGRLNLFVRGEQIRSIAEEFELDSDQKHRLHACLIATTMDPEMRLWTFRKASRACITYARSQQ